MKYIAEWQSQSDHASAEACDTASEYSRAVSALLEAREREKSARRQLHEARIEVEAARSRAGSCENDLSYARSNLSWVNSLPNATSEQRADARARVSEAKAALSSAKRGLSEAERHLSLAKTELAAAQNNLSDVEKQVEQIKLRVEKVKSRLLELLEMAQEELSRAEDVTLTTGSEIFYSHSDKGQFVRDEERDFFIYLVKELQDILTDFPKKISAADKVLDPLWCIMAGAMTKPPINIPRSHPFHLLGLFPWEPSLAGSGGAFPTPGQAMGNYLLGANPSPFMSLFSTSPSLVTASISVWYHQFGTAAPAFNTSRLNPLFATSPLMAFSIAQFTPQFGSPTFTWSTAALFQPISLGTQPSSTYSGSQIFSSSQGLLNFPASPLQISTVAPLPNRTGLSFASAPALPALASGGWNIANESYGNTGGYSGRLDTCNFGGSYALSGTGFDGYDSNFGGGFGS